MTKPIAYIHRWIHLATSRSVMVGYISDHERQWEFDFGLAQTGTIIKRPKTLKAGAKVETKRTIYVLGSPHVDRELIERGGHLEGEAFKDWVTMTLTDEERERLRSYIKDRVTAHKLRIAEMKKAVTQGT